METLIGIGYCALVISIYKYVHWKYFRSYKDMVFEWGIWLKRNVGDYLMLIGVSFITVRYDTEIINSLNYVLTKLKFDWQIPHFEDNTFYWILVPVVFPLVLGKFAKKKIRKPIADVLRPKKGE